MIRGLHGLFYSSEADAARAFVRDKLSLPCTDIGGGWLIFQLPEADLGVHPVGDSDAKLAGKHDVSFYCDDIQGTVADLKKRGVRFTQDPADHGYGYVTYFEIPGGVQVQLYEPKYGKGGSRARAGKKMEVKKKTGKKAAKKRAAAKPKAPARETKRKRAKR